MLPTLLLVASVATSSAAAPCESLKALALPDTTIVSAGVVPAGPFTLPTGNGPQVSRPLPIPVEACRVTGVITRRTCHRPSWRR